MKHEEFLQILQRRIDLCRKTLAAKSKEYASEDDKLYNFKRGAAVLNKNQIEVLVGYMTKHLISVMDTARMATVGIHPSVEVVDEKIGDLINYLILLEATITEERVKPILNKQ